MYCVIVMTVILVNNKEIKEQKGGRREMWEYF